METVGQMSKVILEDSVFNIKSIWAYLDYGFGDIFFPSIEELILDPQHIFLNCLNWAFPDKAICISVVVFVIKWR